MRERKKCYYAIAIYVKKLGSDLGTSMHGVVSFTASVPPPEYRQL